jgi:hypothetical protein
MVNHHFDHPIYGPDSSIFHGKRVKSAEAKESEARASRPRLEDIQQLIRGRIPIDSDVLGFLGIPYTWYMIFRYT